MICASSLPRQKLWDQSEDSRWRKPRLVHFFFVKPAKTSCSLIAHPTTADRQQHPGTLPRTRRCSLLDDSPVSIAPLPSEKKGRTLSLTNLRTTRIDQGRNVRLQQIQRARQRRPQRLAPQEVRHDGQGQLVEEADGFGRVEEVSGLVGAAGDVAEGDAGEGVDGAGVAADGDGGGDHGGHLEEVVGEGEGAVGVCGAEGAAVPGGGVGWVSGCGYGWGWGGGRGGWWYQLFGMRSWPGIQVRVPSGASVMAKKDLRVSLSRMPFGYSAEWLDIKAAVSDEHGLWWLR